MLALKTRFDWRVLIAVVLFFNLAGYFLIPEILGVSRQKLFHFAGVAALEFPFMDLRGVATWCEAAAGGIDPAVTQTSIMLPDGTRQPNFLMNYSPAVVWFYWLGLRPATVWVWASGLIALQILALLGLCGRVSCRQAILWTFLVCSPASLLVMERANMDILVFALFVLALALRRYPLAALAPISLGGRAEVLPGGGPCGFMEPGRNEAASCGCRRAGNLPRHSFFAQIPACGHRGEFVWAIPKRLRQQCCGGFVEKPRRMLGIGRWFFIRGTSDFRSWVGRLELRHGFFPIKKMADGSHRACELFLLAGCAYVPNSFYLK